ncbi:MAG: Photosystem I assembly protein Ycf3 [Gemmatimonadaceae bacterium]|nr:Photosystem I assembly protein Ycf3 [Gemmatimonadaceae bacterium]
MKIIASFNGAPIRFRDAQVIPLARDGRFSFTVRQAGLPDQVIPVDGVIGGGHMEGGGTQGFVTALDDGTYRFVPFDFSRHDGKWFCNTLGRTNRGWVPISDSLPIAACVDWPPVRVLGDESRFSNCMSCHGSQIQVALDTTAARYRTSFTSLGINCESCHGPGKRHIALVQDPAAVASGNIGMTALATYGKDSSLGVCWQCHALKDRLQPGFVSGKPLAAYYSLRTPQLGDQAYLPDGRVRTFAYQQGHWYSDCYVNGGMTCTSCHDPHSQGYRDVNGTPLPGRFDDRQCTSCHASKAVNSTAHTHHTPSSAGSRCTSCHMPYLQEPELGNAIRFARSDHAIPIPRPVFDSTSGVTSACKGCHADRSETALETQLSAWYGTIKPHARAIDGLLRARATSDRAAAARLVLVPDEKHTAVQFDGMAYFLERFLDADMESIERDVVSRLERIASHGDIDVRALALASLHFSRGNDRDVRGILIRALDGAGNEESYLRARWGMILGYLADKQRNGGNPSAAITIYRKALEVEPSAAPLHLNLGLAFAQTGDAASAIAEYRRSLELDARQPLALVNLGIALDDGGRAEEAIDAYRRALRMNPRDPLANFNLGNVYLKATDLANAATYYERAIASDPSIALAHLYLARIRATQGDLPAALTQVRLTLQFDPSNEEATALREQLTRVTAEAR